MKFTTKLIIWIILISNFQNLYSQGAISRINNIEIGDFYYSDGTTSHVRNRNKECVGIVFSLETSAEEKKHGFLRGYIVALKDCSDGEKVNWGKNIDLPSPHTNIDYVPEFNRDKNGYIYNFMGKFNSSNQAYVCAKNYSAPLPPNKTTGWYLPSVGQWYEMLSNLGGLQLKGHFYFNGAKVQQQLRNKGLIVSGTYLTSTERDQTMTWIVDFDSEQAGFYSPWNSKQTKHKVLAVAAF